MKSPIILLTIALFSCVLFTNCTKETAALAPTAIVTNTTLSDSTSRGNSSTTSNETTEFVELVQETMEKQHIPALSALIFDTDKIVYEGYFGQSNIAQNKALQEDHLFLLASVSKVVTATALLQLYEKGHFKLNDPINDYLDFEVTVPGYTKAITFQMLLTHTSGIADGASMDDEYYYGKDSPVALDNYLENYLTPNGRYYDERDNFHNFQPGSEHEYSNIGTALMGVLVEEITGMNFSDYCQQYIFMPLGMRHTAWRLSTIDDFIVQPYDYYRGNYEAIGHYTFTDYPNGGLRSTARDLFQFLSAFVQGGTVGNYQLLKSSTIKRMTTLQIPTVDESMGLHLFQLDQEENLWGHDGGEQGVATIMAFSPDTKVGVILLANQGEADLEELLMEAYFVVRNSN